MSKSDKQKNFLDDQEFTKSQNRSKITLIIILVIILTAVIVILIHSLVTPPAKPENSANIFFSEMSSSTAETAVTASTSDYETLLSSGTDSKISTPASTLTSESAAPTSISASENIAASGQASPAGENSVTTAASANPSKSSKSETSAQTPTTKNKHTNTTQTTSKAASSHPTAPTNSHSCDAAKNIYDLQVKILLGTNSLRLGQSLPALNLDAELNTYAQIRAQELAELYQDTRPNGDDIDLYFQENSSKFQHSHIAENIARISNESAPDSPCHTVEEVNQYWNSQAQSSKHILDPDFVYLGIGYYYDQATQTEYYVQIFASEFK